MEVKGPMFSPTTLDFFAELLAQVTLNAGHPDFDAAAERVLTAKRELAKAQEEASPPEPGK